MPDIPNGVDLDLDALEPQAVQINYKDQLIQVNPLTLAQYAKLVSISSEISDLKEDPTAMISLVEKVRVLIDETIPDFVEKNLNPQQVLAIYQLLVKLSSPEDKAVKELDKQGVSLKGGDSSPKASTS